MTEPIGTCIDGRDVSVFKTDAADAPVVYANMYEENAGAVLGECEKLGCRPFHLVSVPIRRWDEELTPWASEPLVSKEDNFTGEAEKYLDVLVGKIIPQAEQIVGKPKLRVIAGYSLAGLFALWTPYVTDAFSAVISASGSAWYPDFVGFAKNSEFTKAPDSIYLSLGDKECRARNKYLSQAEICTEELHSLYRKKGIRTIFELNPGNHYRDPELRLAKGIAWTFE